MCSVIPGFVGQCHFPIKEKFLVNLRCFVRICLITFKRSSAWLNLQIILLQYFGESFPQKGGCMERTLVANWQHAVAHYGSKLAFRTKVNKTWVDYTYKEMDDMVRYLASALLSLKVKRGDRVGIISDDRLEWIVTDMACQLIGAPDVPRGSDSTRDEVEYILGHAETKIVFVENERQLDKVHGHIGNLPKIEKIVVMDEKYQTTEKAIGFYDLIEKGRLRGDKGQEEVQKESEKIQEQDLATIIYTSGTTGKPKGVMLKQSNFMHNVAVLVPLINVKAEDHLLHILPVWHVFGRILEYIQIGAGSSGVYTNVRELGADLQSQKPTLMGSAPRLWESIYQRILDGVKKASVVRRALFYSSVSINKAFYQNRRALAGKRLRLQKENFAKRVGFWFGSLIQFVLVLPLFPLTNSILGKVRQVTGDHLRASVSGGGALPLHIDEFFEAVGIRVLEGYGLTETSPVIAVRTFEKLIPGSVGPITPETMVQIRDDVGNPLPQGHRGVVWVHGPQVMEGYYKNKEATDKVMYEGWFNTGDLGMITFNDTLKLLGRAKDTIVLLGGENVEPGPVETTLSESPYISQVMVVGQDRKTLGVLVVPDLDQLKAWSDDNGVTFDPEMIENDSVPEEINKLFDKEIKNRVSAQSGFKAFERVTTFALIKKPFEVNDELTAIGKMKRHVITEKYLREIDAMYGD